MRIGVALFAVICVALFSGFAYSAGSFVNGSFEDGSASGDGVGGIFNWTDENSTVSVDNTVFGPPAANQGSHWVSASNGAGASSVDVTQYVTGLNVGNDHRADFAAFGGPTAVNAGVRWIAGDTTGGGNQRAAGADGGSISQAAGGWYTFGGTTFTTAQADYTLYVYAEDPSGWTCGAGIHLDGDADGNSVEDITSVSDWALY